MRRLHLLLVAQLAIVASVFAGCASCNSSSGPGEGPGVDSGPMVDVTTSDSPATGEDGGADARVEAAYDTGSPRDATRRTLLNVIRGRRKTRRHRATKLFLP